MKTKILLVEDEPLLIELYQESFAASPFELMVAANAQSAKNIMSKENIQLILLDILLPDKNGFELLKEIKADPDTRDIPVVVLTNLGSERSDQDRQLALSLGAVDYLVKSFHTPDEIISIVARRLKELGLAEYALQH